MNWQLVYRYNLSLSKMKTCLKKKKMVKKREKKKCPSVEVEPQRINV